MNLEITSKPSSLKQSYKEPQSKTNSDRKLSFEDQLASLVELSVNDSSKVNQNKTNSDNESNLIDKPNEIVENNSQLDNILPTVGAESFILKDQQSYSPIVFSKGNGELLINGNHYNFDLENNDNSLGKLTNLIKKEVGLGSDNLGINVPSELKSKKLPENALLFKQGDQYTLINPEDLKSVLKGDADSNFIDSDKEQPFRKINLDDGAVELNNLAKSKKLKDQIELIEKFGTSPVKVSVENHPKQTIIRETTNNLINEHQKFLVTIKKRAGLIKVDSTSAQEPTSSNINLNTSNQVAYENGKMGEMISNIKETDKQYFDQLREELNGDSSSKINATLNVGGEIKTIDNNSPKNITDINSLVSKIGEKIGENSSFSEGDLSQNNFAKSDKIFTQDKEAQAYQRVRSSEIMSETLKSVRVAAPNGTQTARMILNPESLGKVIVKIEVINNSAKLNIKADTAEAVKLIEKQIGNLVEKLNFSGIQTDDISIEQQKLESDQQPKEGSKGRQQQEENKARKEFLESFKKYSFSGAGNE